MADGLGLYFSPKSSLNFLSKLCIPPLLEKISKFTVFAFLENALNLGIFTNASPLSNQNSPLVFIITPHTEQNYSFLQAAFFRKSVSPNSRKGVEETMICFNKIQSENMKMTWNIRLFIFC